MNFEFVIEFWFDFIVGINGRFIVCYIEDRNLVNC